MAPNMNAGILDKRSNHSVDETLERLKRRTWFLAEIRRHLIVSSATKTSAKD